MISDVAFAEGLTRIGLALRQPADKATLGVYFDALADESDDAEWGAFCRWVVKGGRYTYFPKVSELRDALEEFRGAPNLLSEAMVAYGRVDKSGEPSAQGGTVWSYRAVKESCGRAAAEAFLEAGGHSAFCTTYGEAKTRERFVEAYQRHSRESPAGRLLTAGPEQKALPPGPDEGFTHEEAVKILKGLDGQTPKITKPPTIVDLRDETTRERLAVLKEQAKALMSES